MGQKPAGTEYSIAGSAASSAASAWSWQQPGRSSAASSTSWQKIDEDSDPNDPGWEAKDEELYTKQPTTPSAAPTFNVRSIAYDRTLRRLPGTPVIDTTDSSNRAVMPTQALTTTRDDETNATLQNTVVTTECILGKWYKNYTTYSADGIRDENGDRRVIETLRKEIAPSATAQVAPSNERPSSAARGPIQFVREGHVKPIVPLTADQKWERAMLQQRKEEAAKHERTTSAYEDALYERDRARRYAEIAEEAAKAPALSHGPVVDRQVAEHSGPTAKGATKGLGTPSGPVAIGATTSSQTPRRLSTSGTTRNGTVITPRTSGRRPTSKNSPTSPTCASPSCGRSTSPATSSLCPKGGKEKPPR